MKPTLLNVLAVPRTTNYFRVTPVNDAETNHVTKNLLNNNETNNDETEQIKMARSSSDCHALSKSTQNKGHDLLIHGTNESSVNYD